MIRINSKNYMLLSITQMVKPIYFLNLRRSSKAEEEAQKTYAILSKQSAEENICN
jgi:hypothetical protein